MLFFAIAVLFELLSLFFYWYFFIRYVALLPKIRQALVEFEVTIEDVL